MVEIDFNCFTFSESGDLTSPPPTKQKVGCKGCDFDKGSLRGHLARTTKGCKNLYTAEELKELEMAAEEAKRQRIAEWKVKNREANREKQRRIKREISAATLKSKMEESSHDPLTLTDDKGNVRFKCVECDNSYTKTFSLNRHMATEHLGLRFKCEECIATFPRDHDLEYHKFLT